MVLHGPQTGNARKRVSNARRLEYDELTVYVCNVHNAPAEAVYIGRNAQYGDPIFGNLIVLKREADRPLVIVQYTRWFKYAIANDAPFSYALDMLVARAMNYDLWLACHCAPLQCHGDVLKLYIDWRVLTNGKRIV